MNQLYFSPIQPLGSVSIQAQFSAYWTSTSWISFHNQLLAMEQGRSSIRDHLLHGILRWGALTFPQVSSPILSFAGSFEILLGVWKSLALCLGNLSRGKPMSRTNSALPSNSAEGFKQVCTCFYHTDTELSGFGNSGLQSFQLIVNKRHFGLTPKTTDDWPTASVSL